MDLRVTFSTQCHQLLLRVATRVASKFKVMYLQVLHAAANLATPAVPPQDLSVQFAVVLPIEPESDFRGVAS
jgi:hypothetical protein